MHHLMSERHNDVIYVITQKSRLKCEIKYDVQAYLISQQIKKT